MVLVMMWVFFKHKLMIDVFVEVNNKDQAPHTYNLITIWEHPLTHQVTGNLNIQLIFNLILLVNLLGKNKDLTPSDPVQMTHESGW